MASLMPLQEDEQASLLFLAHFKKPASVCLPLAVCEQTLLVVGMKELLCEFGVIGEDADVGILPQQYTASQPRNLDLKEAALLDFRIFWTALVKLISFLSTKTNIPSPLDKMHRATNGLQQQWTLFYVAAGTLTLHEVMT